jgi:haloacetate dehalogenase
MARRTSGRALLPQIRHFINPSQHLGERGRAGARAAIRLRGEIAAERAPLYDAPNVFEGFTERTIETSGAEIHLRAGGGGPPLLLLHGFPQTHVAWHQIAPGLARTHSVVAADLRGYGGSTSKGPFDKRAMAQDMLEVMRALGHERFAVIGHDRGARAAYRLALDHPQAVTRLAVLDVVPTLSMWRAMDAALAAANWHWLFLAQPAPFPEEILAAAPDRFLEHFLRDWSADRSRIAPPAVQAYARAFRKKEVIRAFCEDYRAGATADLAHDAADEAAGHRIACPLLALWSKSSADLRKLDPLPVWRAWAAEVSGQPIDCGHFMPEEAPEEVSALLQAFLVP